MDVSYNSEFLATPADGRNFAWRRWAARVIDWQLGQCFLAFTLGVLLYVRFGEQIPEGAYAGVVLWSYILGFFTDAVMYLIFGGTLGKWITGIRVCDKDGNKIGRLRYVLRDLKVYFRLWLGFPLFAQIAMFMMYRQVSKDQCVWYDKGDYKAMPKRGKKWYDTVIVLLTFAIFIFLQIVDKL